MPHLPYPNPYHAGSDHHREWEAHVDAGRIGNKPPMDPAIRANLLATDALFRSFRNPRIGGSR